MCVTGTSPDYCTAGASPDDVREKTKLSTSPQRATESDTHSAAAQTHEAAETDAAAEADLGNFSHGSMIGSSGPPTISELHDW